MRDSRRKLFFPPFTRIYLFTGFLWDEELDVCRHNIQEFIVFQMISAFRKTKKWNNFPLSIISHVLEVFHIFFFADAVCNVKKREYYKNFKLSHKGYVVLWGFTSLIKRNWLIHHYASWIISKCFIKSIRFGFGSSHCSCLLLLLFYNIPSIRLVIILLFTALYHPVQCETLSQQHDTRNKCFIAQ